MWKCLYTRANESFIHSLAHSVAQSLISAVRLLAWSIVCARNVKISRANKTNCMAEEKWRARAGVMQKKRKLLCIEWILRLINPWISDFIEPYSNAYPNGEQQQHQLCYTFILQYINKCAMCVWSVEMKAQDGKKSHHSTSPAMYSRRV